MINNTQRMELVGKSKVSAEIVNMDQQRALDRANALEILDKLYQNGEICNKTYIWILWKLLRESGFDTVAIQEANREFCAGEIDSAMKHRIRG